MRILVTGATGYIGETLISQLIESGHTVIATSTDSTSAKKKSWFNNVIFVPYTIGKNTSTTILDTFHQPEMIIHTAWDKLHDYNGLHHIEENVPKHYQFLKQFIEAGLNNITVLGTCFEYGMIEGPLHEDMTPKPITAYGIGKNTLRIYLETLQNQYDFDLKWIRLFYNFGKSNTSNSLFSQLEKAVLNQEKIFNLSPGDQLRDYMNFDRLITTIEKISIQTKITGIINCCSGQPIRVIELVENYIQSQGSSLQLNTGYYPYPTFEPLHFWGDTTKLNKI